MKPLSRTFIDFQDTLYKHESDESSNNTFKPINVETILFISAPYFILLTGLISNFIICIVMITSRVKTIYHQFIVIMLLADSFSIAFTSTNLIPLNTHHTLMTYSNLSCKLTTYFVHLFTNISNWMKILASVTTWSFLHSLDYLTTNRAKANAIIATCTLLSAQFICDLILVERIDLDESSICAIRDSRLRLAVNLVDFVTFHLIPFLVMLKCVILISRLAIRNSEINSLKRRRYRTLAYRVRLVPLFFTFFNLPVCFIPILANIMDLFAFRRFNNTIDLSMYIAFLIFFFNNVLNTFYNLYYNKTLRRKKSFDYNSFMVKLKLIK